MTTYHPYPCTECTLMRCDQPGEACDQCAPLVKTIKAPILFGLESSPASSTTPWLCNDGVQVDIPNELIARLGPPLQVNFTDKDQAIWRIEMGMMALRLRGAFSWWLESLYKTGHN